MKARSVALPFALVLVASMLVPGGAAAQAPPPADLSSQLLIEVPQTGSGPLEVVFTLINNGGSGVSVLSWNTPFDPVLGDIFEVTRDGVRVPYIGILMKRGKPTAADFVVIGPRQSRRAPVDLARFYDLSAGGHYRVALVRELRYKALYAGATPDAPFESLNVYVPSPALTAEFDRRASAPAPAAPAYANCSAAQNATLLAARNLGQTYANNAVAYLAGHNVAAPGAKYTTWFGAATAPRYTTTSNNFTAIANAIPNVTFDCNGPACIPAALAYVNPNAPYTIYPCAAFWLAPAGGTDSQAGTVVHETSHFTVVAGTQDLAYGQAACQALAIANPANAIRNADNYEYFAEP